MTRAGGVEHTAPDEASMKRFVSAAAARDQRDLALAQLPTADEFSLFAENQKVGMGSGEAVEALRQ